MWLLHFLPSGLLEFIVNAVLIIGIVATILSFFVIKPIIKWVPGIASYATLIQVVSVIILTAGVYFKGGYSTEMQWRAKVAEVQAKLEAAENKSREVNTKIETKVITKTQIVRVRGEDIAIS